MEIGNNYKSGSNAPGRKEFVMMENQYLHDVDEECHREVELAVKRIMEKEGVTEQLKNENPLKWVQRVNGIKARVEEEKQKM